MISQGLFTTLLLAAAIAGGMGLDLPFELPFALPLVSLPADGAGWKVLGAFVTLLVVSVIAGLSIHDKVRPRLYLRLSIVILVLGNLAGLFGVALAWHGVETPLAWPFQIPVWMLAIMSLARATEIGKIRQSLRRREVRPASYGTLMEPKNWEAKNELWLLNQRRSERQTRHPVQRRQQQSKPAPQSIDYQAPGMPPVIVRKG